MTRGTLLIACLAIIAVPTTAAAAEGFCEVTISGDENVKLRGSGGVPAGATAEQKAVAAKNGAGSDYWVSDEDLKRTLTMLYGADKLAAKWAADPRATPLSISCGNKDVGVNITASPTSKYATVPQKPGKYRIVPEKGSNPGDFNLIFLSGPRMYAVAAPGTLELTKFDASGVAGKFSFDAVPSFGAKGKGVKVSGTFSFPCQGRGRCKP